ncbi:MAG: thiol-disulfide isomerase, partial [Arthrobacter sp.]|nr:thiol-disulfide isomerase [Arthrobacter sp.]
MNIPSGCGSPTRRSIIAGLVAVASVGLAACAVPDSLAQQA